MQPAMQLRKMLTKLRENVFKNKETNKEMTDTQTIIEKEVLDVQTQQRELEQLQTALSQNEQFTRFIELSKAVNKKMEEVREHIKAVMIPAYQDGKIEKKVKGGWGSVTVTEEDAFKVDKKQLPPKFFKKTIDKAKIKMLYQLEGKAPKGCTPYKKYGIMMKLK